TLERFDRAYETHIPIHADRTLSLRDGERVSDRIAVWAQRGQIAVGIEGDETDLARINERLGANVFMLASDFPHETTTERFLEDVEELRESEDLSDDDKESILWRRAAAFYGVDVAESVA